MPELNGRIGRCAIGGELVALMVGEPYDPASFICPDCWDLLPFPTEPEDGVRVAREMGLIR